MIADGWGFGTGKNSVSSRPKTGLQNPPGRRGRPVGESYWNWREEWENFKWGELLSQQPRTVHLPNRSDFPMKGLPRGLGKLTCKWSCACCGPPRLQPGEPGVSAHWRRIQEDCECCKERTWRPGFLWSSSVSPFSSLGLWHRCI